MRRLVWTVLAALVTAAPAMAADERAPVLVELYTSQGCAPCRTADAYMGELLRRPEVIALSLHIDYWDSPAWRDQFALPEATRRQHAFRKAFGMNYIYTPQIVVDGRAHVSGRLRDRIEGLIADSRRRESLPVGLTRGADGIVTAALPGESAAAPPLSDRTPSGAARQKASVWMLLYDRPHTVDIRGGQNAGQRITYYHVVREMRRIGGWNGTAERITLPIGESAIRERAGVVIILQEGENGPIFGAGMLPFDGGAS
jgi:hypothetical protein